MQRDRSGRMVRLAVGLVPIVLALGAAASGQSPGAAEPSASEAATPPPDARVDLGRQTFDSTGRCVECHGPEGNGQGEPENPHGPSLWGTELSREQLYETIQCGRPGTQMPYHDRQAYRDDRCYDLTEADLGSDMPPRGASLGERQINALVDYILYDLKGRTE